MLGVNWDAIGFAGTFVLGLMVGLILTIRLSKVIADLFRSIRDQVRADDRPDRGDRDEGR